MRDTSKIADELRELAKDTSDPEEVRRAMLSIADGIDAEIEREEEEQQSEWLAAAARDLSSYETAVEECPF